MNALQMHIPYTANDLNIIYVQVRACNSYPREITRISEIKIDKQFNAKTDIKNSEDKLLKTFE